MTAGELRSARGFVYRLTAEDELWCARMLVGEGGRNAATLWTMASRLVLVHAAGYPTLTALLRAYSQPINPKYQRDGVLCRVGGRLHDADACSSSRLSRREAVCKLMPSTSPTDPGAPPSLRDAWLRAQSDVALWVSGHTPNPVPRAVHFAVPAIVEREVERGVCSRILLVDGNAYASTARSDRWPQSFVTMAGAGDA